MNLISLLCKFCLFAHQSVQFLFMNQREKAKGIGMYVYCKMEYNYLHTLGLANKDLRLFQRIECANSQATLEVYHHTFKFARTLLKSLSSLFAQPNIRQHLNSSHSSTLLKGFRFKTTGFKCFSAWPELKPATMG